MVIVTPSVRDENLSFFECSEDFSIDEFVPILTDNFFGVLRLPENPLPPRNYFVTINVPEFLLKGKVSWKKDLKWFTKHLTRDVIS